MPVPQHKQNYNIVLHSRLQPIQVPYRYPLPITKQPCFNSNRRKHYQHPPKNHSSRLLNDSFLFIKFPEYLGPCLSKAPYTYTWNVVIRTYGYQSRDATGSPGTREDRRGSRRWLSCRQRGHQWRRDKWLDTLRRWVSAFLLWLPVGSTSSGCYSCEILHSARIRLSLTVSLQILNAALGCCRGRFGYFVLRSQVSVPFRFVPSSLQCVFVIGQQIQAVEGCQVNSGQTALLIHPL